MDEYSWMKYPDRCPFCQVEKAHSPRVCIFMKKYTRGYKEEESIYRCTCCDKCTCDKTDDPYHPFM